MVGGHRSGGWSGGRSVSRSESRWDGRLAGKAAPAGRYTWTVDGRGPGGRIVSRAGRPLTVRGLLTVR